MVNLRIAHAHEETQQPSIFIVDDSPAILALLTLLLRDIEGYPVETARGVREAIQHADATVPLLILLELRQPGESSIERVRQIRSRPGWAEAPLIISSGYQNIATLARDVGAVAFLPKPFDLDALIALVHQYAGYPAEAMNGETPYPHDIVETSVVWRCENDTPDLHEAS